MSELIYTFTSLAARVEGGKTCIEGMRTLAGVMHPRGVPVTWLVSPESAALAKDDLDQWHREHGDEVAVELPPLEGNFEEKKAYLEDRCAKIRKSLPWAQLTVAGGTHCDPDIVKLSEAVGFEGIWGFCWEQIEVDDITDRGCPWGFYYMAPEDRLRPASEKSVVAVPWLSHDLLKAYHSGLAPLYNNDPNDLARSGIVCWEDDAYWHSFVDQYYDNTRYNDVVFLPQHQEAHEMECTEQFHLYTQEDVRETSIMLGRHVDRILEKPNARVLSLPDAVRYYRQINAGTASSHMLWKDVPTRRPNPDYTWNTGVGPWPKTFFSYDCGAQLIFVDGQVQPACIRNYAKKWDATDFYRETFVPRPKLVSNTEYIWRREIEIVVDSPKAMPYGMAIWGEFSLYRFGECPGLIDGKILPHELLYLRYDLVPGENRFKIKLEGK